MIQRIQTIYILLAAVLGGVGLFLNWVSYELVDQVFNLIPIGEGDDGVHSSFLVFPLAMLLGVHIAAIFQFKNRKQQMQSVRIAMVVALLTLVGFSFEHYRNINAFAAQADVQMHYGMATIFPIVVLVLDWMALKAIKKDEDLVRSVDRLR